MRKRLAILGASGYGGAELLRLIADHPAYEVVACGSVTHAGKPVGDVLPHLRGVVSQAFVTCDEALSVASLDGVFLALPHGVSRDHAARVPASTKLVDLSSDFRLDEAWSYGLTEWTGARVAESARVANPGCFATAVLLGLLPLAAAGMTEGLVVIDAKTGSSGSGATPGKGTHHPTRAHGLNAYKPYEHPHVPEIARTLRAHAAGGEAPPFVFQAHSVPLVRGIYATIYAPLAQGVTAADVAALYEARYAASPFVRLVDGPPDVAAVQGSNYVDLGWAVRGAHATIFVAIDNLMKGAAGQALQNMNLMLGLSETLGLARPGLYP